MNERRRRGGELRGACKRSSTSGHRRHTTTIQPYQPWLKPPCSSLPFHSFASILSLLLLPLPLHPRHRDFDPLLVSTLVSSGASRFSIFSLVHPRPITSGVPHPRRYASTLFFPRVSRTPSLSLPSLLSYSAFISFLSILLLAVRAGLIFSLFPPRYFLLTALRPTRRCTMRINEEHTSKQKEKKKRRLSCVVSSSALGCSGVFFLRYRLPMM